MRQRPAAILAREKLGALEETSGRRTKGLGVVTAVSMLLRLCFVLALILGVAFWAGIGLQLVLLHMALGIVVVLAVWFLGVAQATAPGGSPGLAAVAFIVGAALVGIGLGQNNVLPGPGHTAVQVAHLVVALLAVGTGEACAARYGRLTRL